MPKQSGTKAAAGERPSRTPITENEQLLLPSHEEAKTLCELALRVKALAPWKWMEEMDVFGVEHPDTGELGFVSIMGNVGEYEAVAVYRGAEGLYGFIDLQSDPSAPPERVIDIPQLQAAFPDSRFLEKPDRELLKGAGLKSRGARSYPQFRSYRPGYHPWFVTREEARLLIHALSQTLDVARRVADGLHNFQANGDGGKRFLVRVARRDGIDLIWEDTIKNVARPTPEPIQINIDNDVLESLKRVSRENVKVEADLFLAPAKIGKRGERPMTMYMLMIADSQSGFIFGLEAMSAEDSLAGMYGRFPEALARLLLQAQIVPKQLILRWDLLLELVEPLAKLLKIQLRYSEELPSISEAAAAMDACLTRK